MPHEPHVGAVTIVPPHAFSSLTAKAYANTSPRVLNVSPWPNALTW